MNGNTLNIILPGRETAGLYTLSVSTDDGDTYVEDEVLNIYVINVDVVYAINCGGASYISNTVCTYQYYDVKQL